MRAIKIDADNRSFEVIKLKEPYLDAMQREVGGYIERACTLPNGDEVYCNDEGLLNAPQSFVMISGTHQPFAGDLLVVGHSRKTGATLGAKSTVEEIADMVEFLSLSDLQAIYAQEEEVDRFGC